MLNQAEIDKIKKILPYLNETQKRLYIDGESEMLKMDSISLISEVLGVSKEEITAGIKELNEGKYDKVPVEGEVDEKSIERRQPGITRALESLIEGTTQSEVDSLLRWTTKSLGKMEEELKQKGFTLDCRKIGYMLSAMGYSININQEMDGINSYLPAIRRQFEHINNRAGEYIRKGLPVIFIEYRKMGDIDSIERGEAEDALKSENASPYAVYDTLSDDMLSVEKCPDTATFAVNSIRVWWQEMGKERYPDADKILITCQDGESNEDWIAELQKFSNETGLEVEVCHFPPGISRWNKIEHRMFSQIAENWKENSLVSLEFVVSLIAPPTISTGLV